ncbi:FKBP-type peptidyl-prolyl cis-trans isomerase [Bacteroidales bacterium]
MKIGNQKVVSLTYELREDSQQGELIQKVEADRPFVYLFGVGGLLPKFEQSLDGLSVGDSFAFGLTPDEAYGEYTEEAILDLDIEIFMEDEKVEEGLLEIGNTITMMDNNGHPIEGVVLEVTEKTVKMDFNHLLAGQSLHFSGVILDVREASEEEISHGHVHGPHGHHH